MKEYQFDITLSVTVQAGDELDAKAKAISKFIDSYGQNAYRDAFAFDLFDVTELESEGE